MHAKDYVLILFAATIVTITILNYMNAQKIRQLLAVLAQLRAERQQAIAERDAARTELIATQAAAAELNDPALVAEVDAALAQP